MRAGSGVPTARRPRSGSHSRSIANTSCRMMANQKAAIARPPTVTMRMMWSKAELCQTAASVPSGMPTSVANSQREEGELDGGGQAARDIARDRAAGVGGVAEVGLRHLAQVDEELLPDRLVEAVGLADGGDLGRRRVLAGERGRGVVGQDPQHDEGEDEQAEQRRHDQQQAAQDEAGHEPCLAAAASMLTSSVRVSAEGQQLAVPATASPSFVPARSWPV